MSSSNDIRLFTISEPIFRDRNAVLAEAGYLSTKDFNFKWRVTGKGVFFYISDYLRDAPDKVITQFVKGAVTYIYGGRHVFGQDYLDYVRSDEFILANRPIYLKRTRRITRSDIGECRCLADSVQRLLDMGLLNESDIANTVFTWSTGTNLTRLGYCSQMFRIVMISSAFDNLRIPEDLLDFVVYHECLHLRQGYRPFHKHPHDSAFQAQEMKYPCYEEVNRRLRDIGKMLKE